MPVATFWRFSWWSVELGAGESAFNFVHAPGLGNRPCCAVSGHCLIVCVPKSFVPNVS